MPSSSVGYILGFCTAVCLVCAVLVSSSAVGLKEQQEANKVLDRQKKVLGVAGLLEDGQKISPEEVQSLFDSRIRPELVDLTTDAPSDAEFDPGTFDQQAIAADPKTSSEAPRNKAGVQRVPNQALIYRVSSAPIQGDSFETSQYIFPVEGKGLWSTLYGYVALAPNGNEIKGLTFYQHGETPGLGGEVDNPGWKAKWQGRLAYGDKGSQPGSWGAPQIRVVKGQAGPVGTDPHQVDGLSGATITSNGVTNLLQFWLGEPGFGPFIKTHVAKG